MSNKYIIEKFFVFQKTEMVINEFCIDFLIATVRLIEFDLENF